MNFSVKTTVKAKSTIGNGVSSRPSQVCQEIALSYTHRTEVQSWRPWSQVRQEQAACSARWQGAAGEPERHGQG